MKNLDTFIKKNNLQSEKRKVSQLDRFKEEINQLYESGYKIEVIQCFLQEQGVEVSLRAIYYYLQKQNEGQKNFSLKNPSTAGGKKSNREIEQTDDQEINLKNLRSKLKELRS